MKRQRCQIVVDSCLYLSRKRLFKILAVSETILKNDETTIHFQSGRLNQWTEHFSEL